jgi:hypothetical protein
MGTVYVGVTPYEIGQPGASDDTRLLVKLLDAADPTVGKTGIAFGSVTCSYMKPGETSFTGFPSWGTNNWAENGGGWYSVIIRGGTAAEAALLNTQGNIVFTVAATGCMTTDVRRRVVASDALRPTTNIGFAGGEDRTAAQALRAAVVQATGRWHLVGTVITLYEPDESTVFYEFNLDDGTTPTERYKHT